MDQPLKQHYFEDVAEGFVSREAARELYGWEGD